MKPDTLTIDSRILFLIIYPREMKHVKVTMTLAQMFIDAVFIYDKYLQWPNTGSGTKDI